MSFFTLTINNGIPAGFYPTSGILGAHDCVFVDPYNPEEILFAVGQELIKYHLANDTYVVYATAGLDLETLSWDFVNQKIYTYDYLSTSIYDVTDPSAPLLLSTPASGSMRGMCVGADGTKLYYLTNSSSDLTEYDIATGVSTVIYTHTGTLGNLTYLIASDPDDSNTLFFTDNNSDLLKYDVALGTTSVFITGSVAHNAFCMRVVDGALYLGTWNFSASGLLKIDVDGTNQEVLTGSLLNKCMALDTVNKKIFVLDFSRNLREYSVPLLGDIPELPPPLSVVPGVVSIVVTLEDAGASAYRITITPDAGSEVTSVSTTTSLVHTINADPGTNYTVSLYSDTGAGFVLAGSVTTSTLTNSAANYDIENFNDGSGVYDLTSLNTTSLGLISEFVDDLFTSGQELDIVAGGVTRNAEVVSKTGTHTIPQADREPELVIGFTGATSGQTATFNLTDDLGANSDYTINYNESTGAVALSTAPTVFYAPGESFVLNGKKVKVFEF